MDNGVSRKNVFEIYWPLVERKRGRGVFWRWDYVKVKEKKIFWELIVKWAVSLISTQSRFILYRKYEKGILWSLGTKVCLDFQLKTAIDYPISIRSIRFCSIKEYELFWCFHVLLGFYQPRFELQVWLSNWSKILTADQKVDLIYFSHLLLTFFNPKYVPDFLLHTYMI